MTTDDESAVGFAARWSRRKIEARQKTLQEETKSNPLEEKEFAAASPGSRDAEVDLADLPPIEAINNTTDLTPWLAKKVPDVWRVAALRKVWSSDPGISQFIGPADYAWDWNAPDGVPGFGPLQALDDVAKLLDQAIGPQSSQESVAENTFEIVQVENSDVEVFAQPAAAGIPEDPEHQQAEDADESSATPRRQRGGAALPS